MNDYEGKTLEELLALAEQGHAKAQLELGACYFHGHLGVEPDDALAEKWLLKAAEQGGVDAQFELGVFYADTDTDNDGNETARDYAKGAEWLRRAAEQGHAQAQHYMGGLYAGGLGVAQDYAQAVEWFRKAAEQGHISAQRNLDYYSALIEGAAQPAEQGES